MSITSQTGIMGYGVQPQKGVSPDTWYRHKALNMGFGPVTPKQSFPQEIGGTPNPTGSYKTGAWYAGSASILPRLEGDFGWLLLGLTGYVQTAANATTGFTHRFTQRPAAQGGANYIPWLGFRRYIPGPDLVNDLGDVGLDCVLNAMTFNLPQVGPVSVELSLTGRVPSLDDAPDLWTWADVYETFDSVPMAMAGHFKLPNFVPLAGESLPIVGATVTIANNTTSVDEERVVGSYHPEDFTTRTRVLQVEFTHKVDDYDLYRFIFNGGDPAQGGFLPCIETTDFEMEVRSPCPIEPGVIESPYRMVVRAPKIDWQASPVQLEGDSIIMQRYSGIAYEADSGNPEDYFEIALDNTQSSYSLA